MSVPFHRRGKLRPGRVSDMRRVTLDRWRPWSLVPVLSPVHAPRDSLLSKETGQSGCCQASMEVGSWGPVFPT